MRNREINPDGKKFSWRRRNPTKMARLDYFLVTHSMMDIIDACDVKPSYKSDHSIIELKIKLSHFRYGKGFWKFNNSLLKQQDYLDLINNVIQAEKFKYALPVYNLDYLKHTNNNIQFTIDNDTFLEVLFLQIRGETIKYSSKLKCEQSQREKQLLKDIEDLETCNNAQTSTEILEDKRLELEILQNEKVKGQIVRSRMQWLSEGEKPTSYFCKLENDNFITKTIKRLKLADNSTITDQRRILKEVQEFYSKLFSSRDVCLTEPYLVQNSLINKLKKIPNLDLGTILNVNELGAVLKKMKKNKSPGIDGISLEFLKVFWGKIKYFVVNALNSCYTKGKLSISLRQSVITCIPKSSKDRQLLKNWRPISLLCTIYKLASAAIAERLKPHLDNIISVNQSGFIKGRNIGENTRLVYDLLHYTEKHNIPGLLMLIDFEKAFDSVSWKFLYSALRFFGFKEDFIKWVQIFNTDINAYILQCGFLSEAITIGRGCRQGDPISPYLFLIVAEFLTLLIENNKDIKGVQIGKYSFKIAQFADDTAIILDGTQHSLQATLNVLEIFSSMSGLKMNSEKTKLVWFGSKKGSKEKLTVSSDLVWDDCEFNLLGLEFSVNLSSIPQRNYSKAISKVNKIIDSWRYRNLTPFGKITIIKNLLLSKFVHLFVALPITEKILKDINSIFYRFLWGVSQIKLTDKIYVDHI